MQDVAKLQFAMSIMWMYFFWSQYLVIWYGNVPVETRFFVRRFFAQPWLTLAWVVLIVGWLIPFVYLLKRLTGRPPQRHAPLFVISVLGLVAIFLERVLVVFPSVSTTSRLPIGAARPRNHRRLPRALRAEPPLVHRPLPARPQPPAHGALVHGGPRHGPPSPPTVRRASAKPWRSSLRVRSGARHAPFDLLGPRHGPQPRRSSRLGEPWRSS